MDTIVAKKPVMVIVIPAALGNLVSQVMIVVDSLSGNGNIHGVCVKDQCDFHFDCEKQEHSCCKKQFLNESSECKTHCINDQSCSSNGNCARSNECCNTNHICTSN